MTKQRAGAGSEKFTGWYCHAAILMLAKASGVSSFSEILSKAFKEGEAIHVTVERLPKKVKDGK